MPLFGKKKEESVPVPNEPMKPLPTLEQLQKQIENMPTSQTQQPKTNWQPQSKPAYQQKSAYEPTSMEPKTEEAKPAFAPLFIKLDKYKGLLSAMGYLKTNLVMLRSSLAILKDLDKLREENLKIVEEGMEKMEKKIAILDSEFLRPSGFRDEMHDVKDVEMLEGTVSDLKGQIAQLKAELETLA